MMMLMLMIIIFASVEEKFKKKTLSCMFFIGCFQIICMLLAPSFLFSSVRNIISFHFVFILCKRKMKTKYEIKFFVVDLVWWSASFFMWLFHFSSVQSWGAIKEKLFLNLMPKIKTSKSHLFSLLIFNLWLHSFFCIFFWVFGLFFHLLNNKLSTYTVILHCWTCKMT